MIFNTIAIRKLYILLDYKIGISCRYTGFYKGVQSAGAAVAWQVDTRNVSFLSQLAVNWSLCTISYPLLAILVILAVKDESKVEEGTSNEVAHSDTIPDSLDNTYGGLTKST